MAYYKFSFYFLLVVFSSSIIAQGVTGSLQEKIAEAYSENPISFATIGIINSNLNKGFVSDKPGQFTIARIPVDRFAFPLSVTKPFFLSDVLVAVATIHFLGCSLRKVRFH